MKLSNSAIRTLTRQHGQATEVASAPAPAPREKIRLRGFSTDRNHRENNGVNIPVELRSRIEAGMAQNAVEMPAAFNPWGFL